MPRVYLLYYPADGAIADRLLDALSAAAPEIRILTGSDDVLRDTLSTTNALLVIVGPSWKAKGDGDFAHVSDAADVVMFKAVETALAVHVPIVPILVQGVDRRWFSERPSLAELSQWPSIELRHVRWTDDVTHIVERIEWILSDPSLPPDSFVPTQQHRIGRLLPAGMVRTASRFDQLRRRAVPRTRYWRRLKRLCGTVLGIGALLLAYQGYLYVSGAQLREIRAVRSGLSHETRADAAIADLHQLRDVSTRANKPAVTEEAAAALRSFMLASSLNDADLRRLRASAVEALKTVRANDLSRDFAGAELNGRDLAGVDLSSANLRHVSLEEAFLEDANFTNAILTDTNLSNAYVRNADFTGTTMADANAEELDWYDAKGFTEDQLRAAARSSVRRCPKDGSSRHTLDAFRTEHDDEYETSFENLAPADKAKLEKSWSEYSKPGGLCERVDRW